MSQERQQRRREESRMGAGLGKQRKRAIYAVLIVAAVGLAYYLGNRHQHRYDGFARCLTDRGVKMYGAWWCPHCQDQKKEFGASFEYAPYVECGVKGDLHAKSQVCRDENISHFPTWQFPPMGERVERIFTLDELRDRTGCSLP